MRLLLIWGDRGISRKVNAENSSNFSHSDWLRLSMPGNSETVPLVPLFQFLTQKSCGS